MTRGMLQHSYWEQEHCHSFLLCGFEVLWQFWVPGGEISKDLFLFYLVWGRVLLGFFVTDWNFKSRHGDCCGYVSNCSPVASAVFWCHTSVANCIWAALLRNESIPALLKHQQGPSFNKWDWMLLGVANSCSCFTGKKMVMFQLRVTWLKDVTLRMFNPNAISWREVGLCQILINWFQNLVWKICIIKGHCESCDQQYNFVNIFISSIGDL